MAALTKFSGFNYLFPSPVQHTTKETVYAFELLV